MIDYFQPSKDDYILHVQIDSLRCALFGVIVFHSSSFPILKINSSEPTRNGSALYAYMQFRLHARLFRLPYLNASPFVRPSPMFPIFQKETEGINSIHFLLIYRDRFY